MARFAVILPAAGQSTRFQGGEKKIFADLDGRAVWRRSPELFVTRSDVCQCIVVAAPEDHERSAAGRRADAFRSPTAGRSASSRWPTPGVVDFGGRLCRGPRRRPAVCAAGADRHVFARAAETGGGPARRPVADTIKRDDGAGRVRGNRAAPGAMAGADAAGVPPRLAARRLRPPRRTRTGITDDAQLVEAAGHPVHLVPGSATNMKITTSEDLVLAEAIFNAPCRDGSHEKGMLPAAAVPSS